MAQHILQNHMCSTTEHVKSLCRQTCAKISILANRHVWKMLEFRGLAFLVFQTGQDWGPPWRSVQWATLMWTFGAEQTPCGKVASGLTCCAKRLC